MGQTCTLLDPGSSHDYFVSLFQTQYSHDYSWFLFKHNVTNPVYRPRAATRLVARTTSTNGLSRLDLATTANDETSDPPRSNGPRTGAGIFGDREAKTQVGSMVCVRESNVEVRGKSVASDGAVYTTSR